MNRSNFLKSFVSLALVLIMCFTLSITAFADYYGNYTTPTKLGKNFSNGKWDKRTTVYIYHYTTKDLLGECTVTAGFDTFATDEDYVDDCWSATGIEHYASVRNSEGSSDRTGVARGGVNTGKADIKHTGSDVRYYTFADVT